MASNPTLRSHNVKPIHQPVTAKNSSKGNLMTPRMLTKSSSDFSRFCHRFFCPSRPISRRNLICVNDIHSCAGEWKTQTQCKRHLKKCPLLGLLVASPTWTGLLLLGLLVASPTWTGLLLLGLLVASST